MIEGNGMPIQIPLVEDSPGDVRLVRKAFRGDDVTTKNLPSFLTKPGGLLVLLLLTSMSGIMWLSDQKRSEGTLVHLQGAYSRSSIWLMKDLAMPLPLALSVSMAIPRPVTAGASLRPNSRLKASAIPYSVVSA
jgi:hypothetical protein